MGGGAPSAAALAAAAGQHAALDAWAALQWAAATHHDRLAVVDGDVQLSYGQLQKRAVTLARILQRLGAQRGSRIAVVARNCYEVLVLHFAAAALRAVVVNINTALSPPELAYILGDSGATLLVASRDLAPALLEAEQLACASASASRVSTPDTQVARADVQGTTVSSLHDQRDAQQSLAVSAVIWTRIQTGSAASSSGGGAQAAQLPDAPPSWESLAFPCADEGSHYQGESGADDPWRPAVADPEDGLHLYYTSGTTGRPKGVELSHRVVMLHAIGTILGTQCA